MNSLLIANRNLFGEKGRFWITAGGVAFSVTLILVLLGLYQGWNTQMTKFLGSIAADFWVGQKGSRDVSHSVSILPSGMEKQFACLTGVSDVNTFIGRQVSFKKDNKEIRLFLVGLDKKGSIKPYKIEKGKEFPGKGELIIDRTIANQEKLKVGDKIDFNGKELSIVGISSGGNLLVYSYAFANMEDTREIIDFKDFVNYYLVRAAPDADMAKLTSDLEKSFPKMEVMAKEKFLDHNSAIIRETFLPIIGVLLLIAMIIGIAVIGLTIYTATIEKSQEFGVLKAIGYSNLQIYSIALFQSITAGVVGLVVGNILTILVVKAAATSVGSFIYEVGEREIIGVIIATLIMAVLASLIPLKRLLSIDPANVFKA